MTKIYTFLFLALITASAFATNVIVSGVISTNTTWDTDTVFVDGDINISGAATLTISAGTVILFNDFYKISVDSGNIASVGTELEPIIFTVEDTTGFYNFSHTGWNGIEFDNTNDSLTNLDSSKFIYTNFYYGIENSEQYGGGVFNIYYFSNILIEHCKFENNYSEYQGGAIGVHYNSQFKILHSIFNNNYALEGGGAINLGHSVPADSLCIYIEDCFFSNNYCLFNSGTYYGGGAVKISGNSSNSILNRNYFSNNHSESGAGAILISGYSNPTITNNVIVHNTCNVNGGAIKVAYRTNPIILNNTIAYNTAKNGGGISVGCDTDSILIKNNILYSNTANSGHGKEFYATLSNDNGTYYKWQIENNNIEGISDSSIQTVDTLSIYFNLEDDSTYTGTFVNNIDVDPLFIDTISEFSLMPCSDCINAGDTLNTFVTNVDFAQNNRIFDNIIDLGAIEYQYTQILTVNENNAVCEGDSLFLEGEWQTVAGIYTDTLAGILHCDSIVVTNLLINTNPTVTITGDNNILDNETTTLDAGVGFSSYLWNDLSTNQEIIVDGATTGIGSFIYSVEVEDVNGCKAYDTITVNVDEYNSILINNANSINIYPNPNNGKFVVNANNSTIQIIDSKGNIVSYNNEENNSTNFNLTNLSKGLYFVRIISDNNIIIRKLTIE